MRRKRPCRVCGKWFLPHERAGSRQKVCSAAECQRERHRRACEAWRGRNRDYDRERRLRDGVRVEVEPAPEGFALDPLPEIAWGRVRDAVGLEVAVIVEETAKVVASWTRDAVGLEVFGIVRGSGRQGCCRARDEMGEGGPAP
jgi:hypothetical protein